MPKAGAKVVLVGDRLQLQPIDAGGPLSALVEKTGKAELNHVTRQKLEPWDSNPRWHRQAGKLIRMGHPDRALKLFAERGRLSVCDDVEDAIVAAVRDWSVDGIAHPTDNIILAGEKADVHAVNYLCQQARLAAGVVNASHVIVNEKELHINDVIMFTRNSRIHGVRNGSRGTVLSFNRIMGTMAVRLQSTNDLVVIPYREYTDLDLAYAMTTHKAQGKTVPNVYVLLHGYMQDQHLSYVQATRAVESTRLYISAQYPGAMADVLRLMAKQRPKLLACHYLHVEVPTDRQLYAPLDSLPFDTDPKTVSNPRTLARLLRNLHWFELSQRLSVKQLKEKFDTPISLTESYPCLTTEAQAQYRHMLVDLTTPLWCSPAKRRRLAESLQVWRDRLTNPKWMADWGHRIDKDSVSKEPTPYCRSANLCNISP